MVHGVPPVRPRADLVRLEGYHSPQVDVRVRLNTNESPLPPPAGWQEALADEVAGIDFHRYPDRSAMALRRAIADLHGVDPAWIFAANGSNEVIQSLCLAYSGAGRRVVTFEPTYAMHSQIARVVGAEVWSGVRNAAFSIDPVEVRRMVDVADPQLLFLCSPNNPTGTLDDDGVLDAALECTRGLVVVDEAYGQFAARSATRLLDESRALAVIRTFSKTWSMAAARLGYLIAPPWLVAELEKVVLPYHLDSVKQIAGVLALRYHDDMRRRVEMLVAERERVQQALERLGVTYWRSQANFVLFRVGADIESADRVWHGLVDRSVLVRNCASWPGTPGCLRVTIGTAEENDAFVDALTDVLASGAVSGGSAGADARVTA